MNFYSHFSFSLCSFKITIRFTLKYVTVSVEIQLMYVNQVSILIQSALTKVLRWKLKLCLLLSVPNIRYKLS